MGRRYTYPLDGITMTAAGEMIAITMPANKFAKVMRFVVKVQNNALVPSQQLAFSFTVFTTSTGGTGGSAVTGQKTMQGDPSAGGTALATNSVANSGSVGSVPYHDACFSQQGIDTPAPGTGITLLSGQIGVLNLLNGTLGSGSVTFSGYIETEEEG